MKKNKTKSLSKSARKAIYKDIKLRLVNALNDVVGLLGRTSGKISKTIKKESKKLAKKISRRIKKSPIAAPDSVPVAVVRTERRASIINGAARQVSSGIAQKRTRRRPAVSATAAKRDKPAII